MLKTYKVTIIIRGIEHEFNIQANTPDEASADIGRVYGVRPCKVELVDDRIYYSDY